MNGRKVFLGVAALIACILVVLCGVLYAERFYASRAAARTVAQGMSYSNVVDLLGVMYDKSEPGQYAEVDAVLSAMTNRESVSYVCSWRIRHSRDMYWVGFDDSDSVVEVHVDRK